MHPFTFALFILLAMRLRSICQFKQCADEQEAICSGYQNLEARPMCLSKLFIHQYVAKPLSWATASVTSVALVDFPEESL